MATSTSTTRGPELAVPPFAEHDKLGPLGAKAPVLDNEAELRLVVEHRRFCAEWAELVVLGEGWNCQLGASCCRCARRHNARVYNDRSGLPRSIATMFYGRASWRSCSSIRW